jgi:hypothetical protein
MLARAEAQQEGAEERAGGEIEGPRRLLVGKPAGFRLARLLRQPGKVDPRQGDRARRLDPLDRPALLDREDGAQGGLPARDRGDATVQGGQIQRAPQADASGHVVGRGPGRDPVEQPEPLLGEGERGRRARIRG